MKMQSSLLGVCLKRFGVLRSSISFFFAFERSSEMVMDGVSSIKIERSFILPIPSQSRFISSGSSFALRMFWELTLHSMLRSLFVIWSTDISNEKKRTFRLFFAIASRIFRAKPVFPMPGLPARTIMSAGLKPLHRLSRRG